jgi:hypothetical protein
MAAITGGYGRFVWMATFDSENQVRFSKENRPFVRIDRDGQLLPETKAVIAVIAKHDLVMETGHSTAEESPLLVRESKEHGVQHMVVTHAMLQPMHMSEAQMLQVKSFVDTCRAEYCQLRGLANLDQRGVVRCCPHRSTCQI